MAEKAEDVKEESVDTSTTEDKDVNKEASDSSTEAKDDDLDTDLFGTEEKQIPYKVFKERNSKLRETERKLKTLESEMERKLNDERYKIEADVRRQYEDKLAALQRSQNQANDFSYDDYDSYGGSSNVNANKDVEVLKSEIEHLKKNLESVTTASEQERIKREVDTLKLEFPALDEEHVYAIKRARPEWSWEDCAEYSHNKFSKHLETKWKQLVEKKKAASSKKVVGAEGLRNLKPEDRPKSWADARKKVAQYFGD